MPFFVSQSKDRLGRVSYWNDKDQNERKITSTLHSNLSKEMQLLDVALICVRVVGCMDLAVDSTEQASFICPSAHSGDQRPSGLSSRQSGKSNMVSGKHELPCSSSLPFVFFEPMGSTTVPPQRAPVRSRAFQLPGRTELMEYSTASFSYAAQSFT